MVIETPVISFAGTAEAAAAVVVPVVTLVPGVVVVVVLVLVADYAFVCGFI